MNGAALFAGIILLQEVKFTATFTPAIEVGWLLPREHWGKGYANEGGLGALDRAFTTMKLDEVVALTAASNIQSQRVMQRLGMTHDPHDDFDHPHALGTSLQRCALYRSNIYSRTTEDTTIPPGLAQRMVMSIHRDEALGFREAGKRTSHKGPLMGSILDHARD